MISYVDKRALLHCNGLGKVLLGYMLLRKRNKLFERIELIKLTENTITEKEKLEEELERIEKEGFVLDRGENEKDVRCIAAPIKNYQGRVVAAVSISGPSYRINKKNQNQLRKELFSTCQKISNRLGFQ